MALHEQATEAGVTTARDDCDDFFGDQDATSDVDKERREREWHALRATHLNSGLREGSSEAHEAHLQGGFDDGFKEGALASSEAGFWFVFSVSGLAVCGVCGR